MKNIQNHISAFLICLLATACSSLVEDKYADRDWFIDSGAAVTISHLVDTAPLISHKVTEVKSYSPGTTIETKNINPKSVVDYAQTLIGIPYKYGSVDPKSGFDCSGFITYVFNHFDIAVPRSSIDFTDVGEEISREEAKPGDIILFTGTNISIRKVGHMGIVTFNSPDTLLFIHSTSGKLNSVTVTPLNDYYQSRFLKTIRIFKENDKPVALR